MSQSILIFDFASNEEAAQQARHKVESWKQAFRLGNKLQLKFERAEPEELAEESSAEERPAPTKKGAAKKPAANKTSTKEENDKEGAAVPPHIRILVRLDFSDHEKLSQQRWLDRLQAEEPFKSAEARAVRQVDEEFDKTAELFDSLD